MTVLKSLLSTFRRSRSVGTRRTRRVAESRNTVAENLEQRLLLTNPDPFSSLPGAAVTVYLDFDGHTENSSWNTNRLDNTIAPITTPAFDTNGAPANFSDTERELIEEIYLRVAEDFRPFDINVTTELPNAFPNGSSVFVSIGGDGAWSTPDLATTQPPPNRAVVDGFSDSNLSQTVFVFPTRYTTPAGQFGKNLAAGISEAVAVSMGLEVHEAPDDSRLVGTADVGPILGNGTASERDIWVNEPGTTAIVQDDLAALVSNSNVSYRTDDHGDDTGTATAFAVGAGPETITGVISQNSDVDTFFFSTIATSATISVVGLDLTTGTSVTGNAFATSNPGTNFDPVIRLLDATGNEVSINSGAGLDASITSQLAAGGYFIEVSNGGEYGNLGEYTVTVQGVDTPLVLGNPVLLESLQNAPVTIYLDFDGHIEADPNWIAQRADGLTTSIVNPAYDTDGNPTSFSPAEINAMREIFFRVAEDFAPFNVNVSTRPVPATLVDGVSMAVYVGGDGAWAPTNLQGAIVLSQGAFSDPTIVNSGFVFTDNHSPGTPAVHGNDVAYSVSSAVAAMLGLAPHDEFANGVATGNRAPGTPEVGPLYADASASLRDIWTNTPAGDPSTNQDDLALITNPATNRITYREDDHGDTTNTATPITVSLDQEVVQGVIGTNTDVDVFLFQTLNTTATISVSGLDLTSTFGASGVTNPGANLDPVLTLRSESGAILDTSDLLFINGANESLTATITTPLTAGTYFIEVSNRQEYGNLGEYTITIDGVNGAPVTIDAVPSTFREDAGANASIGRVFRPTTQAQDQDLVIQLVSADSSELTVPPTVTIPAGATSTTFPINAVDDTLADGAQRAEIQTFVNGEFNSTLSLIVQDHEFLTVDVTPNPVREDAGPGGATLTVRRSNTDVGPPNHFVSVEDRIEEYDFEGNLFNTIPVPWHGGVNGNNTGGGTGVAEILVVSDSNTDDGNIRTALVADGHNVTVVTGDYASGNTTLRGDLSQYGAVYWSATGDGFGGVHTDASVFSNLTSYVQSGGRVFVTGYDSVSSPTDSLLISFLGAGGSSDVPPGPSTVTNIDNSLTNGVVDIRGVQPTGGYSDLDQLTNLLPGTVGVVATSGSFGFQWTLRTLGAGEIAYVSNGEFGSQFAFNNFGEHPSWLDTSAGGAGAYNAALRNFALPATNTTQEIIPVVDPNVPRPAGEEVHDVLVLPDGNLAVYNGSDSGALSHYNVTTGQWSHYVIAGLSTETGTGATGGIASLGDFVFLTDMQVSGDAFGLVRLNLQTGELDRFGSVESGFRLFSNNLFQGSIIELDTVSGAIINPITAPAGVAGSTGGLAFDGTTLWALNTASNTIYGLNPDTGALLSTHVLNLASNGGVLATGLTGLASLNGLLYVLDPFSDDAVYVYNPTTRTQVGGFVVGGGSGAFSVNLDDGLAAITGPDALLAADVFNDQIYTINPTNGTITGVFNSGVNQIEGLAVVNGEIYVGSRASEDIRVFSRDGALLRTVDVSSSQVAFGSLALGGDDVEGTIRADNRYVDVTVGLDGFVYGIGDNQTTVRRFDPNSLALESTFALESPVRTITVDDQGVIYGGDDAGGVFAFNPDGSLLRSATSPGGAGLADIQINVSREILMSDNFGQTFATDSDFASFTALEDTTGTSYVTFSRHPTLPTGDLIVTLTNSDLTELNLPTEITIPVNFQEVTVTIDVLDDNERDGDQTVTIDATAPSYEAGSNTVTVTEHEIVGVDVVLPSVGEDAGTVVDGIRIFRSDVDGPLDFPLAQSGAVSTAVPILDDDVIVSQITFENQISVVTDVNVTLSIEHEAIPDLDVYLISPSGTRVELFTDLSSNETSMTETVLDDEAGQRISDGSDPYTGSFVPEKLLSTFDGENPSGAWTLEVIDDNESDIGTLLNWSIEINTLGLSELEIVVSSDDVTELIVPVNVTIPFNQAEVFIPFEAIDDSVLDGTQTVTVSPSIVLPGFDLQADTVDVTDAELLVVTVSTNAVSEAAGNGAITGTVTRTDTDTTNSVVLNLTSSDTTELTVPPTVTIPPGQASTTFLINAVDDLEFDGPQSVIITASSAGYQPTDSEVIIVADQEPRLQLTTLTPNVAEDTGTLTITIARLDADDLTVSQEINLSSSDTTELTVPATIEIPPGEISTSFIATILGDTLLDDSQLVTISAEDSNTANPVINSTSLDIVVADAETISIVADSDTFAENAGAAVATATISVSVSGHTSPLFIELDNSDLSEISVPATVIIPVGETSATFLIDAVDDPIIDSDRIATITGRLAGYRDGVLDVTVQDHEPPVATGPAVTTEDPTPTIAWAAVDGATRYDLWVNDVSRNIIQLFRNENLSATSAFFSDDFQTADFDSTKWLPGTTTTLDGLAISPSGNAVAHLNGSEEGFDILDSVPMDLSAYDDVLLTYSFQRTGRGGSPTDGLDLVFEYRDTNNDWIAFSRQDGSGSDMTTFQDVTVALPQEARHDAFTLRIRSNGALGVTAPAADWFVDHLELSGVETGGQTTSLLADDFESGQFDELKWASNTGVTIDGLAIDGGTESLSVHLDGSSAGIDRLESVTMDLSGKAGVQLQYSFQKTGIGGAPEIGDDLVISYRNADNVWLQLDRQLGSDLEKGQFTTAVVRLPEEAHHSTFAFRIESFGPVDDGDETTPLRVADWFVDSVQLSEDQVFTPTQELGVGRYRFWVRAYDALEQPTAWSRGQDFVIRTRPEIVSPANQQFVAANSFPEISWTSVVDTASYDLWVNNVTTGESQVVRETNLQTTSFASELANLQGGTYRAWVRAVGPDGLTGFWSASSTFTVLATPTNVGPSGTTFDRTPELRWDAVTGADSYYVWLTLRNPGGTPEVVLRDRFVTDTFRVPDTDLADGKYALWVQAIAADGTSSQWSDVTEFTVGGRPEVVLPNDGTLVSSTPTFLWTGITGTDVYEVWVNRVDVPQTRVVYNNAVEVASFTVDSPLEAGTYRLWVRAISDMGERSFWSRAVNFTVASVEMNGFAPQVLPSTITASVSLPSSNVAMDSPRRGSAFADVDPVQLSVQSTETVAGEQPAPQAVPVEQVEDVVDSVMAELAGADWWAENSQSELQTEDEASYAGLAFGFVASASLLRGQGRRKKQS